MVGGRVGCGEDGDRLRQAARVEYEFARQSVNFHSRTTGLKGGRGGVRRRRTLAKASEQWCCSLPLWSC